MIELNDTNGASTLTREIYLNCLNEFDGNLTAAEFGVAYGGALERIGKAWKGRGEVYGFDTFEGHPKQIGEICEDSKKAGGVSSFAAVCMDSWYESDEYGTEKISYEYIRAELDRQELNNVHLVKGLITDKTKLPFKELHYCMLDLDFPLSMFQAYELAKGKIKGYLLLHDCIPKGHIPGCNDVYQKILSEGLFEVVKEDNPSYLVILKRK
jgi:hypothetical protein